MSLLCLYRGRQYPLIPKISLDWQPGQLPEYLSLAEFKQIFGAEYTESLLVDSADLSMIQAVESVESDEPMKLMGVDPFSWVVSINPSYESGGKYISLLQLDEIFDIPYSKNLSLSSNELTAIQIAELGLGADSKTTPIIPITVLSNFAQQLLIQLDNPLNKISPWALCFIDEKVGYGLRAIKDIPAFTTMGICSGVKTHHNPECVFKEPTELCISTRDYRGFASFLQHLPFQKKTSVLGDSLADINFLRSGVEKDIATQNISYLTVKLDNGVVITIYYSRFLIKAGEILGINYGWKYWENIKTEPLLFYKEGQLLSVADYKRKPPYSLALSNDLFYLYKGPQRKSIPMIPLDWEPGQPIQQISLAEFKQIFNANYCESVLVKKCDKEEIKDRAKYTTLCDSHLQDYLSKQLTELDAREIPWALCYINETVGYGVRAITDIPIFTVIGVYAGLKQLAETTAPDDYYVKSESKLIHVSAKNYRGVAGFFPHLPLGISERYQAILNNVDNQIYRENFFGKNCDTLLRFDPENKDFKSNLRMRSLIGNIVYKDKQQAASTDELVSVKFALPEVRQSIAVSNIDTVPLRATNGHTIIVYYTYLDVKAGEMLGMSYGWKYWQVKKEEPLFFYKNGKIVPPGLYKRNPPFTLSPIKVDLSPWKTEDPAQALRRAALYSAADELEFLLVNYPEFINTQDNKQGYTPLHHATVSKIEAEQKVALLLRAGATFLYTFETQGRKSAIDLAIDLKLISILEVFYRVCLGMEKYSLYLSPSSLQDVLKQKDCDDKIEINKLILQCRIHNF